ncbi:XRE family transcriptional regulator [Streptomyces sp. SBT349]|uniref:XRE family transcriptional regulator n=1 Tax=Streptomyces sp. SBT349 TaxID=1580539 RepID=UPI00066B7663|nr:XRE family transcriptional regulator [Streptomyces sp. SBT349]
MSQEGGGLAGPSATAPQPAQAGSPAEFTEALRALRTWSKLTYRQIEREATAHGDTLPASTIATTLGRATLPRERFVGAFTRACGLGEEDVRAWLEARHRIATHEPARDEDGGEDGTPASGESLPARVRRGRRVVGLLVALGVGAGAGVVGTLGADELSDASSPPAGASTMPVTGLRMLAVGSWARIHPARAPELCVTEGSDRTGRYETAVAAQRPCAKAELPRVFLEPLGQDIVQIQWHHPEFSIGCLTVLLDGPGENLLEPREDCADTDRAQQFRVDPLGPSAATHFRLRPVVTDQCLGLRDQGAEDGTEVVQGRCSGAADQDFLIELTPPP